MYKNYTLHAICILLLLSISACESCRPCGNFGGDETALLKCLSSLESIPITNNPEIANYLDSNPVYVSLTTSPTRILDLARILKPIDLNLVTNIIISIPETFGRNGKAYIVPQELENFPKVIINRNQKEDLGPIMKLVPAIEYARAKGEENAIIITIDDDIGYGKSIFSALIEGVILSNAAVGVIGKKLGFWNLADSENWSPLQTEQKSIDDITFIPVHVLEGYGAVAYKASFFDVAMLKNIAQKSNSNCYISDDLVISYALNLRDVLRFMIIRDETFWPFPLKSGLGKDALHHGGGSGKTTIGNFNRTKYKKCMQEIEVTSK